MSLVLEVAELGSCQVGSAFRRVTKFKIRDLSSGCTTRHAPLCCRLGKPVGELVWISFETGLIENSSFRCLNSKGVNQTELKCARQSGQESYCSSLVVPWLEQLLR